MREWERIVKKMGGHLLFLDDAEGRNLAYYRKSGFKRTGLLPKAWLGKDTYIFTKLIQKPREKNYLK